MWAGDISRRVAPPWLGSAQKAGMGAGVRLEPDLLWRSLSVGLTCCLSLKAEEDTEVHQDEAKQEGRPVRTIATI